MGTKFKAYKGTRRTSKGTRSLFALVSVACISLAVALGVRYAEFDVPVESVEADITPPLASVVYLPEDYGSALPLTRIDDALKRRETLSGMMDRLGLERASANQALLSLVNAGYLDARKTQAGLPVSAYLDGAKLTALAIDVEPGRRLISQRVSNGEFHPIELKSKLQVVPKQIVGTVTTSLYHDARQLGAGDQQVVDFASVFSYDVDFQREVHPGDRFEMVYDSFVDERGKEIRRGDVHYAALSGRVIDKGFYRFTTPDDNVTDYFQYNGESATRFLMKTPINGARLSSHFGKRRHPISGYTRLHKGTDFAAPTGTPVYAAGHGVVERASRYGGYGHYVRIRHANGYKTAYAHLSRYGRGIRSGKRVRQGDVIGYVGSTGASTGPHLHYEVYINGRAVNAMTLKLPTGRKLQMAPEVFEAFKIVRDKIDTVRTQRDPVDEVILVAGQDPTEAEPNLTP